MRELGRMVFLRSAAALAFWACGSDSSFGNTVASGDLYFTTYIGGTNVNKIAFDFDGKSLTLGAVINVAVTDGADGLIFTADKDLLVGAQKNIIHKINPTTQMVQSQTAGGVNAYHMALDPSQTCAWATGIPGQMARIPLNPFADGIKVNLSGDDTVITSIAFQDTDHAFYTSGTSIGIGNFGRIDMKTFKTTVLIRNLPGAHGMAYDAFSGDIILFGGINIVQFDPATGAFVDNWTLPNVNFDQGTVDGKGHLFVADMKGYLLFMDYSETKRIGDTTNFWTHPTVAANMDDVAPLSGLGSNPNPDRINSNIRHTWDGFLKPESNEWVLANGRVLRIKDAPHGSGKNAGFIKR